MKITKPNDSTLVKSMQIYFESGDLDEFIKIGGMWIMENARIRYRLDEDDVSDLFILFHGRAKRCLEIFKSRGYSDFPAFLSVFNKHLIYNLFKTQKFAYKSEDYIRLWNETYQKYTEEDEEEPKLFDKTLKALRELEIHNRLVVCLKHNIKLSECDFYFLAEILKKNPKNSLDDFLEDYKQRIERKKKNKEKIIAKINYYNRRIFHRVKSKKNPIQESKQKLFRTFFRYSEAYSLNEINQILGFTGRKANKIYNESVEILKNRVYGMIYRQERTQ